MRFIGRQFVAAMAFAAALGATAASARDAGIPRALLAPTLVVHPARGGAYWVSGSISNSGFVIGKTGVIVIDAEVAVPVARLLLGDIAALTTKPVNAVILTHSDPDHINGLPAFPAGLKIVAHENAKRDIDRAIADPASNGMPPPPEIRDRVPTRIVHDKTSLTLDGVRLELIHTGPAHTDGDLIIYLPTEKMIYAGDLLTPDVGPYPGIHLNKHGSSLGWIASVRAMLALDADLFITGHGEPLSRDQVKERLAATEARRAEIKALFDQGKTLPEAQAALHDQRLPGVAARFPTFVETTYQELTAH